MKKQLFAIVLILSYKLNGVGLSVAHSKPKPLYSRVKSAVYNPIKSIPLKYNIGTEVILVPKYVNVQKSNFSYKLDGNKEDIYTCDYQQIPTTGDYSFDSFSGTSLKVTRKFSRPQSKFVLVEKFTLNNCTKKTVDILKPRPLSDFGSPYDDQQDEITHVNSGNGRK